MGGPARPVPVPSLWRVLAGFLLAPIIPALPFGVGRGGEIDPLFLIVLVVVHLTVVFVGVPIYFLWLIWRWPSPLNFLLVGASITAAFWLVMILSYDEGWTVTDYGTTGDDLCTECGWFVRAATVSYFSIFGGLTGLGFWLIVYWRDPRFRGGSRSGSAAGT